MVKTAHVCFAFAHGPAEARETSEAKTHVGALMAPPANEEERVTDNSTRETAWVVKIAQALEEEKGTIGLRVLKVNLGEASSPHL